MTILNSDMSGSSLIVAHGDIDHSSCGELEEALDQTISQGARVVLVDLSDVAYVDSGGLSVLFAAGRRLRDTGWIGLIGANTSVQRLLELVGALADPAFRLFDDREQAEMALAESST